MRTVSRGCLLLGIVLLSAATGLAISGIRTSGEASAVNTVSMADNLFTPQVMTVPAGTTIEWRNEGQLPHTSTSDVGVSPTWDSGILRVGQTYSLAFSTAGTYAYKCDVHPEMVGAVVVEAAAVPTQAPADSNQTANQANSGPSNQVAPPSAPGGQVLSQASAPTAGADALPVGGGPPPLAGDVMWSALLLSVVGAALVAGGLVTMRMGTRGR